MFGPDRPASSPPRSRVCRDRSVVMEAMEPRVLLAFSFTGQDFGAGLVQPAAVAVADLDGNGTADLAVANASGNDVTILLGTGEASFTPLAARPGVGSAPRGIMAGDIDGDGIPDLVVANSLANSVTLLRGLGGGAFAPGVEIGVGGRPRAMVIADFNADGMNDLAVALFNTNSVGVAMNIGGGNLGAVTPFGVGDGPVALAAADLDGDGDLDLATANITSGNVSILRNSGAGGFSGAGTHAVGAVPRGIAAGDLDGDGAIDLAVANSFSGTVSVLRNTGSGSFAAQVAYAAGNQPNGLLIVDLDGDGLADIATANLISNDVTILGNMGSGVMAAPVSFGAGNGPISLAVADLDADGDLDLAVANSLGTTLTVLWGGVAAGNLPPAVGSVSVNPSPVVVGEAITITALEVSDPDGFVGEVRFYRDSNGDGLLNPSDEALFPIDTDGSDGWAWTGMPSAAWAAGVNRFFAQAFDGQGRAGNLAAVEVLVRHTPRITFLSASPSPLTPGGGVTLTAAGVTDADGSVASVRFFRDANASGLLDGGDQELFGAVADGIGNYVWTGTADPAWGPGVVRFFALATDNEGLESGIATTVAIQSFAPTIASASASPSPFVFGDAVTLAATGVADQDGTVGMVQFYADVNGNGVLDLGTDELVGTDANGSDGYSISAVYPADPGPTGTVRFLARAVDNLGVPGQAVAFSAAIRYRPVVDALFADDFEVEPGETLTLTALASDFDGSVISVTFYRDSNGDGVLDAEDEVVGTDSNGGDGFGVGVVAQEGWGPALNGFFARATDDQGLLSEAAATFAVVNYRPELETFEAGPNPIEYFGLLALDATAFDQDGFVDGVLYYRDVDGDGVVSEEDELLGVASSFGKGIFELLVTVSPEWGPGETTILAVAVDDLGTMSEAMSATVDVQAVPIIDALIASPNPVQLLGGFTLTAVGVHHDDGVISAVRFYRDANADGVFDFDDEFVGSDGDGSDGWSVTLSATSEWGRGFHTFFAVAEDEQERTSPPAEELLGVGTLPTIASFDVTPGLVSAGEILTLTASGVASSDGTIESVLFFHDTDNDGELDVEERASPFVGMDQGGGVWLALVAADPLWSGAVNRFFVLAFDDVGLSNAPLEATATVTALPAIGGLTFSPDEPFVGKSLTLTAAVGAGGPVGAVRFVRDANANGILDEADEVLSGAELDVSTMTASWTGVVPESWGAGLATFFAVPVGPGGAEGDAAQVAFNIWTRVYFPEGWRNDTTINEYLPVVNPNAFEVTYRVVARYEVGGRDQVIFEGVIPAFSRGGITISERGRGDEALTRLNVGYALEVQSSAPVGATLSRYDNFSPSQARDDDAANGEAFTSITSQTWTFADVRKFPGSVFDFVTYYNTAETDGEVTFNLYYTDGQRLEFTYAVGALRRGGVNFDADFSIPAGQFSVVMTSTVPLVASQSRYEAFTGHGFTSLGEPSGGSLSSVATFIDTRPGVGSSVTIFNPDPDDSAEVAIRIVYEDGEADGIADQVFNVSVQPRVPLFLALEELGIAPGRRATLHFDSDMPVATRVSSGDDLRGDAISTVVTGPRTGWLFADAFLDQNTAGVIGFEYLTLTNPLDEPAAVTVLFYSSTGGTPTETVVELAGGESRTIELHAEGSPVFLGTLNFYSIGVFAPTPFLATFTHWDLFQNGGWVTAGTPFGLALG